MLTVNECLEITVGEYLDSNTNYDWDNTVTTLTDITKIDDEHYSVTVDINEDGHHVTNKMNIYYNDKENGGVPSCHVRECEVY